MYKSMSAVLVIDIKNNVQMKKMSFQRISDSLYSSYSNGQRQVDGAFKIFLLTQRMKEKFGKYAMRQ